MAILIFGATGCGAAARDVDRAQNRLDLAAELLSQEQDAAAETEARRALDYDNASEKARDILGLISIFRAQRNIRLIEFEDCLEGSVAGELRHEADELMRQAEREFAKAVELAPDQGNAWQNRAVVAMYFHDWDRAVEYEEKALAHLQSLDSEVLARANLGWAYLQRGELPKAQTALLQSTQRDPNFCLGSYRLAEVQFQRGEYTDALGRLRLFFGDPPKCPGLLQAVYLAGQAHLRLRDPDSAAKAFESCVAWAPKSCLARQCAKARLELVN